ncbi:hypothetical protein K458DRAFT_380632, partial [Lentithecium fluviatile CBS 122367]
MASQAPSPGQMAKSRSIDEPIFLGVIWALLGVSFLSLLGRVVIKYRTFAKLSWDDLLVVLAFAFTLATAVTMQLTSLYMYQLEYVRVGLIYPPPSTFMSDTGKYFKGTVAMAVFFPCTLWSVKFAFLLFFWKLVNKIRSLRWHWYAAFAFTILSFAGAFAATDWKCIASPVEIIFAECATRDSGVRMKFFMWFICAIDVFSDMLIMSIPIVMLWQIRLPMRKRLSLVALFSLVCVTMAIAFVRASQITTYKGQPDNSRTTLWTFVEQCISVIIVCLGSIRVLFTQEQHKANRPSFPCPPQHQQFGRDSDASDRKKPTHPYAAIIRTVDTEMTFATRGKGSDVEAGWEKESMSVSSEGASRHCATCTCGNC